MIQFGVNIISMSVAHFFSKDRLQNNLHRSCSCSTTASCINSRVSHNLRMDGCVYGQSCFSRHNFVSNLFKNCKTKATKLKDKDKDKDKDEDEVEVKDKDKDKDEAPLSNYLG